MSKNVLVTGGAGFIGSLLVEALLARGHKVTVLDNYTHCKEDYLAPIKDKITLIIGNTQEEPVVALATKGQDVIIHLAAQKSVDKSITDPVGSASQNLMSIVALLTHARINNVKRLLLASSAAVYGYNSDFPLNENAKVDPRSPYALEKIVSEQYLSLFYNLFGVDSAALRLFNVYGPRQYSSAPHCGGITIVMDEITSHLSKGEEPQSTMLGDGKQTRDMVYVGDVVDAFICAMESTSPLKGEIYNVCTGTQIDLTTMHHQIASVMGVSPQKLKFKHIPLAEGNVIHSRGDPTKAKSTFNFVAKTSFSEGLQNTWEWMKKNPNFYKKKE